MDFEIWLIYVGTVFALMCTPGPSQLLMVTNSSLYGVKRAMATCAGDLSANVLQMLAAGLGLAALIMTSAEALTLIKWGGVVYLLWLGLRMIIRATPSAEKGDACCAPKSLRDLWLQGFITSAANPKAVVFFAALFPQFIQADQPFWSQFLILSLTYLVMEGAFLSSYGVGAGWITRRFQGHAGLWVQRIGGGFMIGAALLLAGKSIERS